MNTFFKTILLLLIIVGVIDLCSCSDKNLSNLYNDYSDNTKDQIDFARAKKSCKRFIRDHNITKKSWDYSSFSVTDSFYVVGIKIQNENPTDMYLDKNDYKVMRYGSWVYSPINSGN